MTHDEDKITPDAFAEQMDDWATGNHGTEEAHERANELMCRVLEQEGFQEGVEIFRRMEKWYA